MATIARDELSIEFPEADVDKIFDAMNQAQLLLGKSMPESIRWAGSLICQSLSASTRQSKKLRPVIQNPDKRWKTDRRRAPFGVMAYKTRHDRHGLPMGKYQRFVPIFRTGEFGNIRFYDKKSASWFERHGPNRNTWQSVASGPDIANPEIIVPGIMTDRRRVIGRRGLAKRNWRAIGRFLRRNGPVRAKGMFSTSGRIQWTRERDGLRFVNELDYARDALNGDETSAVDRAGNRMYKRISQMLEKKFGAK